MTQPGNTQSPSSLPAERQLLSSQGSPAPTRKAYTSLLIIQGENWLNNSFKIFKKSKLER